MEFLFLNKIRHLQDEINRIIIKFDYYHQFIPAMKKLFTLLILLNTFMFLFAQEEYSKTGIENFPDYLLGNSSFSYKQNHGNVSILDVGLFDLNYGITDYISVDVGTAPLVLLIPLLVPHASNYALPFWAKAKISVPVWQKKLYIGGGGYYVSVLSYYSEEGGKLPWAYMPYGGITYGSRDNNISVNLYIPVSEEIGMNSIRVFHLAGKKKWKSHTHFIGEFVYFRKVKEKSGFIGIILGANTQRPKAGWDYGFMFMPRVEPPIPIPILRLTYPF